jgi:hypothetical protein
MDSAVPMAAKIAVALIGQYELVRMDPLDTRGHGQGSAMGRFHHVKIEHSVRLDRTPNRRHANGFFPEVEFVDNLGHQTMGDGMPASGAIGEFLIR